MTYITTNHQFVIDDKHPSDAFDDMANFFSLYTVTLDSLNRLSIQLSVPADFDINNNVKIHNAYQQFIKAVRYSIPDVNVLAPIHSEDNDGVIGLMIQHYDGVLVVEDTPARPSLYQKMLGVFLPTYEETHEPTGLYPERATPVIAEPVVQPIPQPQAQPTSQPQLQHQTQPQPQHQTQPQTQVTPVVIPRPIAQPVIQPQVPPQPLVSVPVPPFATQPQPAPITSQAQLLLPKPNLSIKPYRELLTQAIIQQAQQDKATQNSQNIRKITLKSRDSLTTAMIETLFHSFDKNAQGQAYDAIDLVSYGLEELRPKLAGLGINLAEDTQFLLNAKTKATPTDLQRLGNGQVAPSQIQLGAILEYGNTVGQNSTANQPISSVEPVPPITPAPKNPTANPANANLHNIAINVQISDSMGERTLKIKKFPVLFATRQTSVDTSAKLIKVMSSQQGEFFMISEQDGQLLAQKVAGNVSLQRGGNVKPLQNHEVLLPNDSFQIGNEVKIMLLVG